MTTQQNAGSQNNTAANMCDLR